MAKIFLLCEQMEEKARENIQKESNSPPEPNLGSAIHYFERAKSVSPADAGEQGLT